MQNTIEELTNKINSLTLKKSQVVEDYEKLKSEIIQLQNDLVEAKKFKIYYSCGMKFKVSEYVNNEFMLVQVSEGKVLLINTANGNRWNDDFLSTDKPYHIPSDVFHRHFSKDWKVFVKVD